MKEGIVLETGGGVYTVALADGGKVEASIRGRLKLEERTGDQVVIGDRVAVADAGSGSWALEEVLPRETEVVRRAPGQRHRARIVAANVDRLLVVMAAARPDPNRELVDRLLLVAETNGLEGVLVVNKMDLDDDGSGAELAGFYRGVGYPVVATSAATGEGIPALAELLCRGTSALVGPSGGGKSSLLNAVEPDLGLRTGELSRKRQRGRHTTVSGRLIELECGGLVADTPGFSDVGMWGVEPEDLDACFLEFAPHLGECRFRGCAHLEEPDCAVKEAVEEGEIDSDRYRSYRRLRAEAEEDSAEPWER